MKTSTPMIVSVLLPIAGGQVFDYLVKDNADSDVKVGSRVVVTFGNNDAEKIGIALAIKPESDSDKALKSIKTVLTDFCFSEKDLTLLKFAARYYATPLGMVLRSALPKLLRSEIGQINQQTLYRLTQPLNEASAQIPKNASRQLALLELLATEQSHEAVTEADFAKKDLDNLTAKGLLHQRQQSYFADSTPIKRDCFTLTDEQQFALSQIRKTINGFSTSLLFGVTGSGKTEVYIQLIAELLENGKQVLVLVPEISLTPQTLQRFQDRFGKRVAALHSGMTDTQRKDVWLSAQNGELALLLGTRSSIFTPFANLGLIIVDEEHDQSYKQQDYFTYNARDLAMVRGQMLDIPVLLGSATPSSETLHNVAEGKIKQFNLLSRTSDAKPPSIHLIDRRQDDLGMISQKIINEMRQALYRNEQVILFLNKRGFAPVMLCGNCDWHGECRYCSAYKTVHKSRNLLLCHHCGNAEPLPTKCPSCGEESLHFAGLGTEKIEQFISEQFPKHQVLRLDRDKQTTAKQLDTALAQIHSGEVDIIIGTQLLVKGHHFPKVSLVGVIDSDASLYSSDFRAEERLLQQLFQVAGRAGREQNLGHVYIQTKLPNHPLFAALIKHDYLDYAKTLLAARKDYALPPFAASLVIKASHKDRALVHQFLVQLKQTLITELAEQIASQNLQILGPAEDAILKKQNRFCFHLFITATNKKVIQTHLPLIEKAIAHYNRKKQIRTIIDVDPLEII